jgi:DNA-directed RNA polymerase subunit alpha
MLSLNKNWNSLIKPNKISCEVLNVAGNVADVVVEPLERGFGLTIGNAVRRVLLSSLQGAAITAIRIPGVVHEFASKSGVKEDILDLILNLKLVNIRMNTAERRIVRIKAKGPCVVTAGMIESTSDVEVINGDQIICTVSKGHDFEMELICETGKGYVPATANDDKDTPIDLIAIDALFSPIKRVSYRVEDTRVGHVTDYDKLILNIETDGTVAPDMAVALAARILQDQLSPFVIFEEQEDEKTEAVKELDFNPVLLKKVSHLELSVRSQNCLQNDNIVYIGDLVVKTESEMLRTQNFGRKSLNEIKDILSKFGLKFGMDVPSWPPENLEELAKKYEDPYN